MISTKTNRILFIAIALSTSAIVTMENEHRQVAVINYLTKSEVTLSSPALGYINGQRDTNYYPASISPIERKTFSLPQDNSHFKILLPNCYNPSSIDVNITKNKEIIYIVPYNSPKEKTIIISDTSCKELAKINSSLNPAKYHAAKILVLEEIAKNNKTQTNM